MKFYLFLAFFFVLGFFVLPSKTSLEDLLSVKVKKENIKNQCLGEYIYTYKGYAYFNLKDSICKLKVKKNEYYFHKLHINDNLTVKDDKKEKLDDSYPITYGNMLIFMSYTNLSFRVFKDKKLLFKKAFYTLIVSFSFFKNKFAVGLLDGQVLIFDTKGNQVFKNQYSKNPITSILVNENNFFFVQKVSGKDHMFVFDIYKMVLKKSITLKDLNISSKIMFFENKKLYVQRNNNILVFYNNEIIKKIPIENNYFFYKYIVLKDNIILFFHGSDKNNLYFLKSNGDFLFSIKTNLENIDSFLNENKLIFENKIVEFDKKI